MVCSYLCSVSASSFLIPHSRRLMAGRVVQKLTLWRPAALGNLSTVSVCRWYSTLQSVDDNKCWQVSSHGRICNTKGIVTHGTLAPSGYRVAKISSSTFKVHHLVVYAFHGPSQNPLAWQVNPPWWQPIQQSLQQFRTCDAQPEHATCLHWSFKKIGWPKTRKTCNVESSGFANVGDLFIYPGSCRASRTEPGDRIQVLSHHVLLQGIWILFRTFAGWKRSRRNLERHAGSTIWRNCARKND